LRLEGQLQLLLLLPGRLYGLLPGRFFVNFTRYRGPRKGVGSGFA
jgi:hypothetical protein